jgi:hypothetical protein
MSEVANTAQIRNATAQARLKPGVKLVLLATPHHRAKALRQVLGNIDDPFLTDEGQHLLLLLV